MAFYTMIQFHTGHGKRQGAPFSIRINDILAFWDRGSGTTIKTVDGTMWATFEAYEEVRNALQHAFEQVR